MQDKQTMRFVMRSSSTDGIYEIVAARADGLLRMKCDCPAGENGQHCKHRIALLSGGADQIADADAANVAVLRTWLAGTPLENVLADFLACEREMEDLKVRQKAIKRRLASAMLTGKA